MYDDVFWKNRGYCEQSGIRHATRHQLRGADLSRRSYRRL